VRPRSAMKLSPSETILRVLGEEVEHLQPDHITGQWYDLAGEGVRHIAGAQSKNVASCQNRHRPGQPSGGSSHHQRRFRWKATLARQAMLWHAL
jgi:hypothetical protein